MYDQERIQPNYLDTAFAALVDLKSNRFGDVVVPLIFRCPQNHNTALLLAAQQGYKYLADTLIKHGADVNAMDAVRILCDVYTINPMCDISIRKKYIVFRSAICL